MAEFATSSGPDGAPALAIAGELDISGVDEFLARAGALIDTGADPVDLDLGRMTFIDSSGLGALVRLQRSLTSEGRQLQLLNVPRPVSRLLELTGLSDLFMQVPSN